MDDHCPICFEAHNDGSRSPIWRWPCGHGVHAGCIAQTRASLLTIKGQCYVCRQDCHDGALDNFKRAFPFLTNYQVLEQVPDDVVEMPLVHIPYVSALCCPRLAGPIDGRFVELPGDRRMKYMGLNNARAMSWTCMTCHRDVLLQEIPRVTHACLRHGPMCYVLDLMPQGLPGANVFHRGSRLEDFASLYWSCCDATQEDEPPLPIRHLYPTTPRNALGTTCRTIQRLGDDRTVPNQVIDDGVVHQYQEYGEDRGDRGDRVNDEDADRWRVRIEEIESSINSEDAWPDRSMDDVDSNDGMDDAEIPEAAFSEAEIAAAIEEAAIEEASWYEIDGTERVLARDPIPNDDVEASRDRPPWNPIARDALFGDDRPPRIPIAMMDDPDEPFHTGAEVEMFQRIIRDYETAEEQRAMEGLLSGYTDE